jgi:alkylated DNA repair protein (DNA oxidative demethylase)
MSVAMTSAGGFGWVTDRKGYRYEPAHPDTGAPWPPIPESVLAVWRAVAGVVAEPDSCLINHYAGKARMGLHQDKDEADFSIPVVSISLGDPARFRIGGAARADPTRSIRLLSGDVLVMGGAARLLFHGVDRIEPGGDDLLAGVAPFEGGRINLTLRRAQPVQAGPE